MTIKNDDDNEIIKKILNGDKDAYVVIVEKYKTPIFNLAFRMTGKYEDASDLSQEAFIKAYKSILSYDLTKKFFPWLYTIAINLIKNHLKKDKISFLEKIKEYFQNDTKDPEEIIISYEESERMMGYLSRLSFDIREAIILRYYQNLSFEDIGEILNISLSNAKMRVYRGLEKLESMIKKEIEI
ncbi:MAG: RNA polymerase sigma factor [Desulfobacterales bacterium]|nr:RNA polymerase sigma factor [Desulfobacterales bacterium]